MSTIQNYYVKKLFTVGHFSIYAAVLTAHSAIFFCDTCTWYQALLCGLWGHSGFMTTNSTPFYFVFNERYFYFINITFLKQILTCKYSLIAFAT